MKRSFQNIRVPNVHLDAHAQNYNNWLSNEKPLNNIETKMKTIE